MTLRLDLLVEELNKEGNGLENGARPGNSRYKKGKMKCHTNRFLDGDSTQKPSGEVLFGEKALWATLDKRFRMSIQVYPYQGLRISSKGSLVEGDRCYIQNNVYVHHDAGAMAPPKGKVQRDTTTKPLGPVSESESEDIGSKL